MTTKYKKCYLSSKIIFLNCKLGLGSININQVAKINLQCSQCQLQKNDAAKQEKNWCQGLQDMKYLIKELQETVEKI